MADLLARLEKIGAIFSFSKTLPEGHRKGSGSVLSVAVKCGSLGWRGSFYCGLLAFSVLSFLDLPSRRELRSKVLSRLRSLCALGTYQATASSKKGEWRDARGRQPRGGGFIMFTSSGFASAADCCRRFSKSFNLPPSSVSPVG